MSKFVNLHGHCTVGSVFDGLGYPSESMDYVFEQGGEALALTDHGSMAGVPYQVMHLKEMRKQGKQFRVIFGVEAYYVPSIAEWKIAYAAEKERKAEEKKRTKQEDVEAEDVRVLVEDEGETRSVKSLVNRRSHLVLLAMNQEGLNNLYRLVSMSNEPGNFYRYPRIDMDMLRANNAGIIALSACMGGIFGTCYYTNQEAGEEAILDCMRDTTDKFKEVFGDRFYAEVQWNLIPDQHVINQYVIRVAKEKGVKLVSTCDYHFPKPSDWKDRELYKRLGWMKKGGEAVLPSSIEDLPYQLYPKTYGEVLNSFYQSSQKLGIEYDEELVKRSLEETYDIAMNRIQDFYPDNTVRLPSFAVPANTTGNEELHRLSYEGLRFLKLDHLPEYRNRLKEELNVIKSRGFSEYFLTMRIIANCAKETQLVGPGRGSAAGSLVSYCLGITAIDPIKYSLLFSRFLRSDAKDYPDIDFDTSNRDALVQDLISRFGKYSIVPISNYNTLQIRSLIKDASKFYGVPFVEVNEITNRMMAEATAKAKEVHEIKSGVYNPTWEECLEYSETLQGFLRKYPEVGERVKRLQGQVRALGRHAGGVVVGEHLNERMPLVQSAGNLQAPWPEGQTIRLLEPMGHIKFDLLALKTLRMFEGAIRRILKNRHNTPNPTFEAVREFYERTLHPKVLNLDDQRVYENVFHAGKFAGIFQMTNLSAQKFCMEAKPRNIEDFSAITSIYRPGPLGADVHKTYLDLRANPERVMYVHPVFEEVTKETMGLIVYQEHIALLAHKLGKDISLDEGNKLRKLLIKGKSTSGLRKISEEEHVIYKKFEEGCLEKGLDKPTVEHIWNSFVLFNSYAFCKSHAAAYSVISYQCAWLLTYYPAEWLCAYLDAEMGEDGEEKEHAINVARNCGFDIKSADINYSDYNWEASPDGKTLYAPLAALKGLGDKAIEQLIAARPINSIDELLFDENKKANKRVIDAVIRAGAATTLVDDRFSGDKHLWLVAAENKPKLPKHLPALIEEHRGAGWFTTDEKIENITSLTGLFPFDLAVPPQVLTLLAAHDIAPISEYRNDLDPVWFVPREITVRKTKTGKEYWVLRVIDLYSKITEIKCWGITKKDRIETNHPYMAKLEYDEQWGFSTRSVNNNFRRLR